MVAKTYQNLKQIGEPFVGKSGKQYVIVLTKNGIEKEVRWYTEKEYYKLYPNDKSSSTGTKTQKEILGFEKGYVTIFTGNTYEEKEYFKLNNARYNRVFGWYIISTENIPDDLPQDIFPLKLPWEVVGREDGSCLPEEEMQENVDRLLYPESAESEYVGDIGESIEATLTVESVHDMDGYYGTQRMHVMTDENQNCFVWTTGSKQWDVGTVHHVRAKVKAHKTYHGRRQTIINYTREI